MATMELKDLKQNYSIPMPTGGLPEPGSFREIDLSLDTAETREINVAIEANKGKMIFVGTVDLDIDEIN